MFRGIGLKLNWRLQVEDWIVVILLFFYLETLNWRLDSGGCHSHWSETSVKRQHS